MDRSVAWTVPQIRGAGRHYDRAPIIEALIDLEVDFEDVIGAADIERSLSGVPDLTPIHDIEFTQEWDDADRLTAERTIIGYSYKTVDGDAEGVARYRTDRFSFSLVSQYSRWEDFIAVAEGRWDRYKKLFQPSRVEAVGVRFVNRIDVGIEQFDVSDYLRTGVQISPYLSQAMASFFAQVQIPMEGIEGRDCLATITTAPAREADGAATTALILDIDVTQKLQLSTTDPGFDSEFQDALGMLRRRKSEVFEACITDATRNLIN